MTFNFMKSMTNVNENAQALTHLPVYVIVVFAILMLFGVTIGAFTLDNLIFWP